MKRFHLNYNLFPVNKRISGPTFVLSEKTIAVYWDSKPKTAVAIVWWAKEKGVAPPTWVEFEKPATCERWTKWQDGNGYTKVYAEATAELQILGEEVTRRVKIEFWEHYDEYKKPLTMSCSWTVTELA